MQQKAIVSFFLLVCYLIYDVFVLLSRHYSYKSFVFRYISMDF